MTGSSDRSRHQSYAVIIGLDGMTGLQSARILAKRGVPVIAIAKDPNHHVSRTRVCDKILFANTENEEFIEVLLNVGNSLSNKAVLYPCSDMSVQIVSKYRNELEAWYHVALPPHDVVTMLMDKVSFYRYAQKGGLRIPRTFILDDRNAAEEAAEELSYPAILKPCGRSPEWDEHSMYKVYRVANAEQLLVLYDQYNRWIETLIAQEWIEGPDENLFSCNCYFNSASEPMVTFVARKIRQWPPRVGKSCLGVECRNDQVLDQTIQLFRGVRYRGLGYLEMKQDQRTGDHYIVEPNIGRPTGRSAIAEAGGVELLYTMYCDSVGLPLPAARVQMYTGAKWMHLRRDLQSALYYRRQGQLTVRDWLRSVRGKKTYALFSWTDPGPFIGDWQRVIRLYLQKEERRKRSYRQLSSAPAIDTEQR